MVSSPSDLPTIGARKSLGIASPFSRVFAVPFPLGDQLQYGHIRHQDHSTAAARHSDTMEAYHPLGFGRIVEAPRKPKVRVTFSRSGYSKVLWPGMLGW